MSIDCVQQDKSFNKNINGKTFVFTGFRNKDYEKIILDNGGKVVTAVAKSNTATKNELQRLNEDALDTQLLN